MVGKVTDYLAKRPGIVKRKRYGSFELSRREAVLRLIVDVRRAVPCADCHQTFPTCCMDFDHLPGFHKVADVTALVRNHRPIQVVLDEIAKCEVVCSNCHRIRTRERKLGAVEQR